MKKCEVDGAAFTSAIIVIQYYKSNALNMLYN
jgi:hypothetical protein